MQMITQDSAYRVLSRNPLPLGNLPHEMIGKRRAAESAGQPCVAQYNKLAIRTSARNNSPIITGKESFAILVNRNFWPHRPLPFSQHGQEILILNRFYTSTRTGRNRSVRSTLKNPAAP